MNNSCDDREKKKIPFTDVAKGLNQTVESADPLRAAGLERLLRVRTVKEAGLKREHERLTAKLGADHPRVAELAARLDANRDLVRDIKMGVARAQTPAVQPGKDEWIVHGYVRRKDRAGAPNLTVAPYGCEDGEWRRELGYACTDKNGYFKLCHGGKKASAGEFAHERDAARTERRDAVCLHVIDAQGAQLAVDKQPLAPEPGRVDYREIILGDDEAACRSPDEASRTRDRTAEEKPTRYLGNSAKRELHDLSKITKRCQLDEIRPDHRVYFKTQKEATEAGYDYCAYCFGKEKSKR